MSNTTHGVPWDQFPTECSYYLILMGLLVVPLFVLGSVLVALLPRRQPNVLARRIVRLGLALGLFLGVGSLFNGLWSCLVFDRLYYSMDYFVDFTPFWPITQGRIDASWGNEQGKLLGVSLTQLQLVWCPFALGTWGVTFFLYRFIRHALDRGESHLCRAEQNGHKINPPPGPLAHRRGRGEGNSSDETLGAVDEAEMRPLDRASRTAWASQLAALMLFPCSLGIVALAWNGIAPDRLYHYRYGSPPISNFIPPFLHPPNDTVTVGQLRGYFIWPEWSVYVIWCAFIAIGLAVPAFVSWRMLRDGRAVNRALPVFTKRRLQMAFLVGGLFIAAVALFVVASKRSAAPCAARLIVMDGCKQYWAQVNHKTAFDTPTWDDLRAYFPREWRDANWRDGQPVCPEGGTYTLGPVGLPPTCSIGGRRHTMP